MKIVEYKDALKNAITPFMINIEGVDGTGKQTVAGELSSMLTRYGIDNTVISFPVYESKTGALIKDILHNWYNNIKTKDIDIDTMCMMMAIDKRLFYQDNKELFEKTNSVIICDRSYMSNFFYQGVDVPHTMLNEFMQFLKRIEIDNTPIEGICETGAVSTYYLYHNSISTNQKFMRERKALDQNESDLKQLSKINTFANMYETYIDRLNPDEVDISSYVPFKYGAISCSSGGVIASPYTIASEILYKETHKYSL